MDYVVNSRYNQLKFYNIEYIIDSLRIMGFELIHDKTGTLNVVDECAPIVENVNYKLQKPAKTNIELLLNSPLEYEQFKQILGSS